MLHEAGSGHPGGSLSACEILAVLYFRELKNLVPENPYRPDRDRFILSKGHAAPALYAVLAKRGFLPESELRTLRKAGSKLQGHPDMTKVKGVEISSGSLGMGISFGIGTALASRINGLDYRVYVLVGDGELDEGQNWEALMCAPKYRLNKLTVIVDYNGVQLDGTNDEIMPLTDLKAKFVSFGWNVIECNGHDVGNLSDAFDEAGISDLPSIIIAKTVKGKGISYMEGKSEWHGRTIDDDHYKKGILELGGGS